jgi:ornithine carbamoyltransferase
MYFNKPSTRTRVSFVAAAHHLGLMPLTLGPDDLQLSRGETIGDTARTLSLYSAAIVIRTFSHADVEELAAQADVPVINALTDEHHPCQAIADVLTLREHFGHLDGLRVAFVGDFNNVARSLMEATTLLGGDVVVATPGELMPKFEFPPAAATGTLSFTPDVYDAVRGADVVYTDVWISMGDHDQVRKAELLERYRVDEEVMSHAASGAIFMHCLPAHRGEEVAVGVIDGPRSMVWPQAENRMFTEEAILFASIPLTGLS